VKLTRGEAGGVHLPSPGFVQCFDAVGWVTGGASGL